MVEIQLENSKKWNEIHVLNTHTFEITDFFLFQTAQFDYKSVNDLHTQQKDIFHFQITITIIWMSLHRIYVCDIIISNWNKKINGEEIWNYLTNRWILFLPKQYSLFCFFLVSTRIEKSKSSFYHLKLVKKKKNQWILWLWWMCWKNNNRFLDEIR